MSAVILFDEHHRLLTARSRGTQRFMLPGGKPEPGETALQTAVRECREELGIELDPAELHALGHFRAAAANQSDMIVAAEVFTTDRIHPVVASAEIAELRWLDLDEPWPSDLAPLLLDELLPRLRRERDAR